MISFFVSRFLLILFFSSFAFQCELLQPFLPSIQGEFAFTTEKTRQQSQLERYTKRHREYSFGVSKLVLFDDETLNYMYKFSGRPSTTLSLEVVLEHLPLDPIRYTPISPFPIYIEKKSKSLEEEVSYIFDSFQNLNPGNYRILIVYDHKVLDSQEFQVLPRKGYISIERELENEEKGITDDLAKYSR